MVVQSKNEITVVARKAIGRVQHTAWISAWVWILSFWILSFEASSFLVGFGSVKSLCVSLTGVLFSCAVFLDALIRLFQYQAGSYFKKALRLKLLYRADFRAVPTHFIENGDHWVGEDVDSWLREVVVEVPEVCYLAEKYKRKSGKLRIADAVNLKIFVDLTTRRLQAGYLSA